MADAKGQRSILVNAPVQTDKTADSIKEIIKEFDYYLDDQPIRYDELEKAKSSKTLRLPGRFETLGSLLGGMTNICLLYTSPSPRDMRRSRMPSSA